MKTLQEAFNEMEKAIYDGTPSSGQSTDMHKAFMGGALFLLESLRVATKPEVDALVDEIVAFSKDPNGVALTNYNTKEKV